METRHFIPYENGYDPYIDFLKGYLILSILFIHACAIWEPLLGYSLYYLWASAPTGCFLLISTMHFFRKGVRGCSLNLRKHIKKVLLPFLLIQIIIISGIILLCSINYFDIDKIFSLIKSGGYGVGSYFPWVYIQYIIVMMIITPVISAIKNKTVLFIVFVTISTIIEFLCSIYNMDDDWYRVTVLRYPFLIYLGLQLDREGIFLSKKRIAYALVGLVFIILFTYGQVNLEPLFFNTCWKTYHWICYPYMAYFLMFVVYWFYLKSKDCRYCQYIMRIGKASYGIFLFQSLFYLIPTDQYGESVFAIAIYIPVSMAICTVGGLLLKEKVLDLLF